MDAVTNDLGRLHQRGTETSLARDPIARAAAVEIHTIVPPLLHDLCRLGKLGRFVPAELTDDRVLLVAEVQEPWRRAERVQLSRQRIC